jgi:hypothetical protein
MSRRYLFLPPNKQTTLQRSYANLKDRIFNAARLGIRYANARAGGGRQADIFYRNRLATDGCASDTMDIGSVDTEILQLTRTHTTEFSHGLTILAPIVERACYVHDDPLSEVS